MEITDFLSGNAGLVDAELERVVPRDKQPAEVYSLIWDFLDRGGKRFRPLMCLLAAEAVGGSPKKALPAAAAIELFHNFSLIHDDLEDDSQLRRGKPCLHIMYGMPLAINAGDGLFMLVWNAVFSLDAPAEKKLKAQQLLNRAFTRVLEGQGIELNWHQQKSWNIKEADYFRMVRGKTGALISASCEVGAFLGGGTPKQQKALADFGLAVGVAFQIQDDILNVAGNVEKYRKEIGGDIREGKRTLMVIHALNHCTPEEKRKLISILDAPDNSPQETQWAISLLRKYRSIEYASQQAKDIVAKAKAELTVLKKNEASRKLLQMADFLINREV